MQFVEERSDEVWKCYEIEGRPLIGPYGTTSMMQQSRQNVKIRMIKDQNEEMAD